MGGITYCTVFPCGLQCNCIARSHLDSQGCRLLFSHMASSPTHRCSVPKQEPITRSLHLLHQTCESILSRIFLFLETALVGLLFTFATPFQYPMIPELRSLFATTKAEIPFCSQLCIFYLQTPDIS